MRVYFIKKQSIYSFAILSVFLLIISTSTFSQETIEEKLLEEQAEVSDQSELYEILSSLRENPININTANVEKLKFLPGLTPDLQFEIIRYREKKGPFSRIEDLLEVPGMDQEILNNIREFLIVAKTHLPITKEISFKWRTRISDRIDLPRGFEDGTYESSSQKIYNRFRFEFGKNIQGGMLLEKDSGERRLDDLKLFYVSTNLTKNIFLLFGNYQLEIGQGLVLWGPYGFSKGATAVFPIKKQGRGIRGYSTVDENAAFFGGAASYTQERFQLISFASQTKLDATPISENEVSGFYSSGFHRNKIENEKKDVITETALGGRVEYKVFSRLTVGATYYISKFDKIINNPDFVRDRFKFRGKENAVGGFDWNLTMKNFSFYGEAARSQNGGRAIIAGALLYFPFIQLAFLYRNYQKDYHNFHSFAFSNNNGNTQNERGFYTGIEYKLTSSTKLTAYYDFFSHPWRTYFEPLPIDGKEFFSQIEQKAGSQIKLTFRLRAKYGQKMNTCTDALKRVKEELVERRRTQWRFQLDFHLSNHIRLRGRFEFIRFNLSRFTSKNPILRENGILLYQEIRVMPKRNYQLYARLLFFHTNSFNSRIFEFENDLPGVVTNRALFGRGMRWYLLLKYKPVKISEISIKYSETYRDDVSVFGSGPDQVDKNLDRRIAFQIEMKI